MSGTLYASLEVRVKLNARFLVAASSQKMRSSAGCAEKFVRATIFSGCSSRIFVFSRKFLAIYMRIRLTSHFSDATIHHDVRGQSKWHVDNLWIS